MEETMAKRSTSNQQNVFTHFTCKNVKYHSLFGNFEEFHRHSWLFFSFCSCFSTLVCRRVDVFVVVVDALCMDFWSQFLSFPCWGIVNITHYSSAGETMCLWFMNEILKGYLFYHLSTCTVLINAYTLGHMNMVE